MRVERPRGTHDIVPADLDWPSTLKGVAAVKSMLEGEGLFVEIVAPRLWEDPRTLDGLTKWIVATRAAVLPMTVFSSVTNDLRFSRIW